MNASGYDEKIYGKRIVSTHDRWWREPSSALLPLLSRLLVPLAPLLLPLAADLAALVLRRMESAEVVEEEDGNGCPRR